MKCGYYINLNCHKVLLATSPINTNLVRAPSADICASALELLVTKRDLLPKKSFQEDRHHGNTQFHQQQLQSSGRPYYNRGVIEKQEKGGKKGQFEI